MYLGPFGDWLAGFIDGEGCFLIPYRKDRDHWYCQFRIRVRGDDSDIIDEIHSRTGIGRTFFHRRNTDLPNRGDLACWEVSSRGDCKQLVEILEKHPLRAKKARDYAIWREAVLEWHKISSGGSVEWRKGANGDHWEKIAELSSELKAGRKYLRAARAGATDTC